MKNKNYKKDEPESSQKLTGSLENNIALMESIFSGNQTLIVRRLQNSYLPAAKCCILYLEEMVSPEIINDNIITPVLSYNLKERVSETNLLEEMQYKVILCNNIKLSEDINQMVSSVLYGDTLFLLEGYAQALILVSKGWHSRPIIEPESSKVVRGPREGFTESIYINLSMLQRKIQSKDLKFKFKTIGERTRTKVCICHIEGLALEKIYSELERRLDEIKIDGVLDSGYIQELIQDEPFSPFGTVGASERPDVIAAKLLEGRIALVVDGSPFALTVPYVVAESFQSNEDYYNNYFFPPSTGC